MLPGNRIIEHRPTTSGGSVRQNRSVFWPTSSRFRVSSSSSVLVSIITLIGTALVISLVIGQPIQPVDGQSAASTSNAGSGMITTTAATTSSSLGSRGLKRASQQRPAALDQQQQQQQQQQQVATNGMAPFYSIKDGKTSARRIQQQLPTLSMASPSAVQRNLSSKTSQPARPNEQAADGQRRKQAPETMQDMRQTMTSSSSSSSSTNDETNNNSVELANQNVQSQTGQTMQMDLAGGNLNDDDLNENEPNRMADKNKPADFNQLAPMSGDSVSVGQQQLANMMSVGSFNQLVANSDSNRMGNFKPSSNGGGSGGGDSPLDQNSDQQLAQAGDADENVDDKQQQLIQSTTSSTSNESPSLLQAVSSSTSSGASGEPTSTSNVAQQSATSSANEPNKFMQQQPAPIKQSSKVGVKESNRTQQPRKQQPIQQPQATLSGANLNQQQQFQQMQPPSSFSMNFDGMIVNSRPRAKASLASGSEQQIGNGVKSNQKPTTSNKMAANRSNQQQARQQATNLPLSPPPPPSTTTMRTLNDDSTMVPNGLEQQYQNGKPQANGGNSRRVPFSGVPFSSPASKGQRTKPKASNQFGGFSSTMANSLESTGLGQQSPESMNSMRPVGGNDNAQRSGFMTTTLVGDNTIKDEQQQQQQRTTSTDDGVDQQQLIQGGNELMNSVLTSLNNMNNNNNNNNGQSRTVATGSTNSPRADPNLAPRFNQVATSKLPNGDMLMSVISSDDGRERKLVMISRDTLDSLQRFAGQQQQQMQLQQVQINGADAESLAGVVPTSTGTSSAGWWPSTTTISTPTSSQQFEQQQSSAIANAQQQRQKTTTQMPISFSTSVATTRAPSVGGTDEFVSSTSGPSDEETASMKTIGGSVTTTSETGSSKPDTFREVSVQQANVTNGQQQSVANKESQPVKSSTRQKQTGRKSNKQPQNSGTKSTKAKSKQVASMGLSMSDAFGSQISSGNNNRQASQRQQSQTQKSQVAIPAQQISSLSTDSSSSANGVGTNTDTGTENSVTKQRTNNGSSSSNGTTKLKQDRDQQKQTNGRGEVDLTGTTNVTTTTPTTPTTTTATTSKRTKSGKTQKSNQQKQQAQKSNNKSQSARKQPSGSIGGSNSLTVTQPSASQQQQSPITTTQAPILSAVTGATNGQQLPRGRLPVATQSSVELDTESGRPGSVETLETNRRQNGNSPSSATTSTVSSARAELDRQLDEMERANAADAQNQAAAEAMLDSERNTDASPPKSELDGLRAAIPGEPLVDYPIYSEPPARSSFQCQTQSCPGGYYADPDSQCQVFHVCQNDGRMDTFLCPNGTIFSQQHFVCVWWWQVDCSLSRSFYKLNDAIYCNSMTLPAAISAQQQQQQQQQQPVVATSGSSSARTEGSTVNSGNADDSTIGSQIGQSFEDSDVIPQRQQQRSKDKTTMRQRNSASQNFNSNIVMSTGPNGVTLMSSTPRSTSDMSITTTAATLSTSTSGGDRTLTGSIGSQSTRQQQQQQQQQSVGNNQLEGTTTQMALTNFQDGLNQSGQQQEMRLATARNQTTQGDQLNENDMNQQQQQQLELLSRRAA